ncbi:MAG: UDP-2,4-diacetamido-2,4,6-trideoxy-beta-L-altropyranose hydrolase [Deltaproteobacteria bacterium]|nr:UDP-2,4-diacetamido-2,4,6-trideoxy-beta-L-altropyranose hydrolase [Deltaproteobacteria bacterium]MBW2063908.1 UDP-2,4-diacetamido-2,4,6-trideoxy-beta-L-altropyranose hydrolase [Deltaproteobacteria bacterium]
MLDLIIRADASAEIGTGHVMRCLALAQACQKRGGRAIFVTGSESDIFGRYLLSEGFQVVMLKKQLSQEEDLSKTVQALKESRGGWLVLDGYHFGVGYQRRIKQAGQPLLVIDDIGHLDHYYADIVLNQNFHGEKVRYSCEAYTDLILGAKYALLREEFVKWRGWRRQTSRVAKRVLVTLGGADPDNVTLKVIRALQMVERSDVKAIIVVGLANTHLDDLRSAAENSMVSIELRENVKDMPELMAWADVCIAAGGITSLEIAFMGLPSIFITLAENQKRVTESVTERGIGLSLGYHGAMSPDRIRDSLFLVLNNYDLRFSMCEKGKELVDGLGTERVLNHMEVQGEVTKVRV